MTDLIDEVLAASQENAEEMLAKLESVEERIVFVVVQTAWYDAIHGPTTDRYRALCDRVREMIRSDS